MTNAGRIKNLVIGIFALGLPLLLIARLWLDPAAAVARDNPGEDHAERIITVPSGKVINRDYFAFGDIVEISGTVNGDVYAAAGQILVDGTINGDLLAAGGTVRILGRISQDARIAGGQVTVGGEIARNLTVTGGDVDLTDSAAIRGGIVAAGGNVSLASRVTHDARIAAGNLTVANNIHGNLEAAVGAMRLTSRAVVGGDLTYWSDRAASIDPNARIAGKVTRRVPPGVLRPSAGKIWGLFAGLFVVKIISLISTGIIGLLLIYFFPRYTEATVAKLRTQPWASLGWGLIALILTPVAFVILMATVVGIPLGLIVLALYAISLYISRVFVILWAGTTILERFRRGGRAGWALVVGLLVYFFVTLIPFLGGLALLFILLFGLGAATLAQRELYLAAPRQETAS